MMEMINKKRNKKGFTLIELVVVIAILGILAAIAVPRFTDVSKSAKIGVAEANHRTLVSAVKMAELEEGVLPDGIGNLDDFVEGGVAGISETNVIAHTWDKDTKTLKTVVTGLTSKKYTATDGKGTTQISVAEGNTTFTTKFQ